MSDFKDNDALIAHRDVAKAEKLNDLYKGSACTMLGYIKDELYLYINQLIAGGYLKPDFKVYETTGAIINETFGLDDPLPDELNVFIIDLDDMNKLNEFAIGLRFQMGYRWLDDIVNNKRRDEFDPDAEGE